MTTRPSDHDLTALVESAASGAVDSAFSVGKSRLEWSDMGPEQKNAVRESALPFIFHGMKALADLGYSKPRTITTAEELDALPVQAIIRGKWLAEKWADEDGELWYVAGKGMLWDTEQLVRRGALPATILYEPQP